MPRSRFTASSAVLSLLIVMAPTASPRAAESDAASVSRTLLMKGDASGAAAVLESALGAASTVDRPAILERLAACYEAAAKKAESLGRVAEAESFRDNLEILRRKTRGEPPKPETLREPIAPRVETIEDHAEIIKGAELANRIDPVVVRAVEAPVDAEGDLKADLPPLPVPSPLPPPPAVSAPIVDRVEPSNTSNKTTSGHEASPRSADEAFSAKRYEEAGSLYAGLDRAKILPADRRAHWAYCRAFLVVKRINNRPRTKAEWDAIDAEIRQIATLSPSLWFAEYLRSLASERSRGARKATNDRLFVRGSSPEETSPRPRASTAPASPPGTVRLQGSNLEWNRTPILSLNFQCYFVGDDPTLAQRALKVAEEARGVQMKRWGITTSGASWSPKCEVLLYPNPETFSRDTQQPPDSPGFSSMGMNSGRIVFRRVNLRVDHPNMLRAILPHEVTHVVLADLFPRQQIPRWADEGLAVLAEPLSEQAVRAADLEEPLGTGRLFKLSDLMVMDYPQAEHWNLYYAQSVSLTRYLMESGTPAQFIKFVQNAQQSGFESALREVYAIESYEALQKRWIAYARKRAVDAETVTASSEAKNKPESTKR